MNLSTFMIKHGLESLEGDISPSLRAELTHNAEVIEGQIARANQIINNLRLFHSGGRKKLVYESIAVNDLVGEAVSATAKEVEQEGIELSVNLSDVARGIRGNKTLFTQVLVNIIRNAAQALLSKPAAGTPTIAISTSVSDDRVEIAIEDNGPGIPEADLAKVAEPFYSTRDEGSGLGLALCLDILNSYQGALHLANVKPRGLRATVSFVLENTSGS